MHTAAATVLSPRDRALSIGAVILSTLGVGVSYGIGYPLTALMFEQWEMPTWMTGLAGSAPALAIFVLLPFFPRLVGRLGAVVAMTIGCVVVAGGFALMALIPSPEAWIVIRFLMGAGLALPWLVGETWINTITTEATRARTIALYSIALFSGFAAGPLVLEAVGIDGALPFVIGAVGIGLAVVPILMAASLAPRLPAHPETGIAGALLLVPVAMAGAFLGGFLEMSHFALLANYTMQNGLNSAEALRFLTVLMIGGVVLQFVIGWIADRLPRVQVLIGLAALFAAAGMLLPMLISAGLAAYFLVFVIGGLLVGFYTLALAIIGERVQARDLAVANAAFLIMYQAGAMIGPATAGAAMSFDAELGFIGTMVGAALLIAATMAFLDRRGRSS
jgi:MFS family permease